MYHVSKNARAQRSAALICDGLAKCMEEKPFQKITVNDVLEKCHVSRASFYRLFDNKTDVLFYEGDRIFHERLEMLATQAITNKKEQAIYCMKVWFDSHSIVKPLIENHMEWVIYETYQRNAELLKKGCRIPFTEERQSDYFISLFASVICSALSVYLRHGGTEPIEEVYEAVGRSISCIDRSING